MDMLEVVLTRPDRQVYALVTSAKDPDTYQLVTPADIDYKQRLFTDIHHARYTLIRIARQDKKLRDGPLPPMAKWSQFPAVKPNPQLLMVIHDGRLSVGAVTGPAGSETLYIKGYQLPPNRLVWWSYL